MKVRFQPHLDWQKAKLTKLRVLRIINWQNDHQRAPVKLVLCKLIQPQLSKGKTGEDIYRKERPL